MKLSFKILILAITILFYSCEKEEILVDASLTGKWKLFDTYLSIGGPLIYTKATTSEILQFKETGDVSDSNNTYKAYKLKDSTTITLIKTDNTEQNFYYSIHNGLLNLGNPGCIEGCGSRYSKVE